MSNYTNSYQFGAGAVTENLFLFGVGGDIADDTALAALFTFSVGEVASFTNDGTDVKAEITNTDYTNIISAFQSNANLTSVVETAGYYTEVFNLGFAVCSNLVNVSLIGCTALNISCFSGCSNLEADNVDLPALTKIGDASNPEVNVFFGIKDGGGTMFLPELLTIRSSFCFRFANINLDFPKLTNIYEDDTFRDMQGSAQTINIPNCIQCGATTGDDRIFLNIESGASSVINIDASQETIDGGSPDGDLVYAAGRSVTINYI